MIRIRCGTCGTSQGYKSQADGALKLPAAEERRLVARGVADYVTKPIIGTDSGVATPGEGGDDDEHGETPPEHTHGSTGQEMGESGDGKKDEDPSTFQKDKAEADDVLEIVDGHFTIESLMKLSRADMEKLAADMDVDVKKCQNKSDIAARLSAVEVEDADNDEDPPDLSTESPVV